MNPVVSKPFAGDAIGRTEHGDLVYALDGLQTYFDDIEQLLLVLAPFLKLEPYSKAALPAPDVRGLIYVSDEVGGAIPAFSDGTNWRRVSDRAIVS